MSEVVIRIAGRAGRITLNRPEALNALTLDMVRAIDRALIAWEGEDRVEMVIIDAAGERAFCSGGDITEMYRSGRSGDFAYGRGFWAEEYRMNRRLFRFPKPVAAFLHGFVMGGGVGVGCHASHRVVGESARVAMPECGIGLVPDVGGSLILARAPGHLGEYLGMAGTRMGPADAIHAGFADWFVPQAAWPDLIARLERTAEWHRIEAAEEAPPPGELEPQQDEIDAIFGQATLRKVLGRLGRGTGPVARAALEALGRNSPLSMACTFEMVRRVRTRDTIEAALEQEHRFTWRAMEQGDFLEGIRAAIIDKDRTPKWRHDSLAAVPEVEVSRMLAPLGGAELTWGDA